MNRHLGLVGPLLVGTGAWLIAPDPHPLLSSMLVLGLIASSVLVGLVGVLRGSQVTVGVSLFIALATTVPPIVPMAWMGPLAVLAGAAVSLEAANAKSSGLPMAPPRAWLWPLGLTALGSLVALLALTTRVGRESLDLTQGVGLAVSAPFLLGAAFAVLEALRRRSQEETDEEATTQIEAPSTASALVGVGLVAMVIGGGFVAMDASAQSSGCELPRDSEHPITIGCDVRWELLSMPGDSEIVTGQHVEVTPDNGLLLATPWAEEETWNLTIHEASMTLSMSGSDGEDETREDCMEQELELTRAREIWTNQTSIEAFPEGTNPRIWERAEGDCTFFSSTTIEMFTVTEDVRAWSNQTSAHGWRLLLVNGANYTRPGGFFGPTDISVTYSSNPPRVTDLSTSPSIVNGTLMAPADGTVEVDVTADRDKGGLKEVLLRADGGEDELASASIDKNESTGVSFDVKPQHANARLSAHVLDWDGSWSNETVANITIDHEDPHIEPSDSGYIDAGGDVWRLANHTAEGEPVTVSLDIDDDACLYVDECLRFDARSEEGTVLAEADEPGQANVTLPAPEAGDHTVDLTVVDAAGREVTIALVYEVSEDRAPLIEELTVTDPLGRANQQEAGLPVSLTFAVADESPPLEVRVQRGDETLATSTVEEAIAEVQLAPVVEHAGSRPIEVHVEDRWGNTQRATQVVEIYPARSPAISVPGDEHVPDQATLEAFVEDRSLTPENVTVTVTRGGDVTHAPTVEKTLEEDGVTVTVQMPEMMDDEAIGLSLHAVDQADRFQQAQAQYRVDARTPSLDIRPTQGTYQGDQLWTTGEAGLNVTVMDEGSGVEDLRIVHPVAMGLDETGQLVPVESLGLEAGTTEEVRLVATDGVGQVAYWNGTLALTNSPPTLGLAMDGHSVVASIGEDETGIQRAHLKQDGTPLSVPDVTGEHPVPVPDVRHGDRIQVTLTVENRAGLEAQIQETLTVQEAPPEVTVGTFEDGWITTHATDPDGYEADTTATVEHRVNGTTTTPIIRDNGSLELPAWHGDVEVRIQATAGNLTTVENRTVTLGEGPFLTSQLPETVRPGETIEIPVSWTRDYERIQITLRDGDGQELSTTTVTETQPGEGHALLEVPQEGDFEVDITTVHEDGTVSTASVGTVDADEPPSVWAWLVTGLLLLALVGVSVLYWYGDEDQDPPREEAA